MGKTSRVTVFDQWSVRDDKRLAAKPLSLRLPTHVQARLFALEDLYPNKSRNDLLIDLLKVGLEEFEEAAEFTYGFEEIEDEQGNSKTFRMLLGQRFDFQALSNKHYKKLEIEKGNKSPLELFKIHAEEVK